MRYLLDANAVIALLNDTTSPIARRVRRYAPRDIGVSAIVTHELYYGAFKSQRVEKNVARVDALQFDMVRAINSTHLTALDNRGDPPVKVECATCTVARSNPACFKTCCVANTRPEGWRR